MSYLATTWAMNMGHLSTSMIALNIALTIGIIAFCIYFAIKHH